MAIHPLELIKRTPWEVWVGLVLTVVVAWVATRKAVGAGQASVQPTDVGVGTPTGGAVTAGPASSTDVGTISQQIADLTKANQDSINAFTAMAGGRGYMGSATNSGFAGTGSSPSFAPGGSITATGAALQTANATAATSSSGFAGGGGGGGGSSNQIPSGPGGTLDAARAIAADIGTHSATDSSGNTYTINSTYAAMTDAQRADANRFAHGYSG